VRARHGGDRRRGGLLDRRLRGCIARALAEREQVVERRQLRQRGSGEQEDDPGDKGDARDTVSDRSTV